MDNKERRLGRWLSVLYRQYQAYINASLKNINISSSEYFFLLYLYRKDGITQDELSIELFIDKSSTARALKSLEKKGYVSRKNDIADKRMKRVYITEKALLCKDVIKSVLQKWNDKLKNQIGEHNFNNVTDNLEKISVNIWDCSWKSCGEQKNNE